MSPPFRLTTITRDPGLAARADAAGVDRIGVDIERLGKRARQGHIAGARISDHDLHHLEALRPVVTRAALFARLNPPHDGTGDEIEAALAYGARVLMLPWFTSAAEVEAFVRRVDGRASATLLLENSLAVAHLHEILAVGGVDEIIVGMNDLSLSCGLPSAFELLASDTMDHVAAALRARGVPFGFGGLARVGDDTLPVPADLVIAQHPRLGSSAAWLSRSFFGVDPVSLDIAAEVQALRARLDWWEGQPSEVLDAQREVLRRRVAASRRS